MGRRIFDNLQKALGYIFAVHANCRFVAYSRVLCRFSPYSLAGTHCILELIIDPSCSIIFEAEKKEKNVMSRPPKDINEPFLVPVNLFKLYARCLSFVGYFADLFRRIKIGYEEKGRAFTFVALIASNITIILSIALGI